MPPLSRRAKVVKITRGLPTGTQYIVIINRSALDIATVHAIEIATSQTLRVMIGAYVLGQAHQRLFALQRCAVR